MSTAEQDLVLIGVGCGGCKFVEGAVSRFGLGIRALGIDTDALLTRSISGVQTFLIGARRYEGRSTGGDSEKGRRAALDDVGEIVKAVGTARLAIVVTSLGGGVGTGATPVILEALNNNGIITLCIVTLPFELEGKARLDVARRALPLLEERADAVALIRLDDLAQSASTIKESTLYATRNMSEALTLVWSLLTRPGYISISAENLINLIAKSKAKCRFAFASAAGEDRAKIAASMLVKSPLLGDGNGMSSAQAILLGVLGSDDLRLCELSDISNTITGAAQENCELVLGTVQDSCFTGIVKLVAFSFENRESDATIEATVTDEHSASSKRQSKARLSQRRAFGTTKATLINGVNYDIPTYQRMGLKLDR